MKLLVNWSIFLLTLIMRDGEVSSREEEILIFFCNGDHKIRVKILHLIIFSLWKYFQVPSVRSTSNITSSQQGSTLAQKGSKNANASTPAGLRPPTTIQQHPRDNR